MWGRFFFCKNTENAVKIYNSPRFTAKGCKKYKGENFFRRILPHFLQKFTPNLQPGSGVPESRRPKSTIDEQSGKSGKIRVFHRYFAKFLEWKQWDEGGTSKNKNEKKWAFRFKGKINCGNFDLLAKTQIEISTANSAFKSKYPL